MKKIEKDLPKCSVIGKRSMMSQSTRVGLLYHLHLGLFADLRASNTLAGY
jgi:hypothetical protein